MISQSIVHGNNVAEYISLLRQEFTPSQRLSDRRRGKAVPSWGKVASQLIEILQRYSTGVTQAIILAELEKNYLNWVIHVLTLRDDSGRATIDTYLHHRFSTLALEKSPANDNAPENSQSMLVCGRTLRMTGCRVADSSRASKLIMLPCEYMVPLVDDSDGDWLNKTFIHNVESAWDQQQKEGPSICWLQVKITKIEVPTAARPPRHRRLVVHLEDCNDILLTNRISLVLWDDQITMSCLFSQGDTLYIHHPLLNQSNDGPCLEYGTATVIYCQPYHYVTETVAPSQHVRDTPSQCKVRKDAMGLLDYSFYPERVYIEDIQLLAKNMVLLARVVNITSNLRVQGDERYTDSYWVTLADDTGKCDITFEGSLARQAASLQPGHLVLVEGLQTAPIANSSKFNIKCISHTGARLHNVSSMVGFINTPPVSEVLIPLCNLKKTSPTIDILYCCRAKVIEWIPLSEFSSITTHIHSRCLCPVEDINFMDSNDDITMMDDVIESDRSMNSMGPTWYCPRCCGTVSDIMMTYAVDVV
eukprot:Ihof_evm9s34 gene=Ihof_evmTU9s34